jgi:hypothetical protein
MMAPTRVVVCTPLSSRARVCTSMRVRTAQARRQQLTVRAEVQESKKNGDGFMRGVMRAVRSLYLYTMNTSNETTDVRLQLPLMAHAGGLCFRSRRRQSA